MTKLCCLLVLAGTGTISIEHWFHLKSSRTPDSGWTIQRMEEEMAGLGFKSQWVDSDRFPSCFSRGLYLAHDDDPRTWEEIADRRPKLLPEKYWCGLVVVSKAPEGFVSYQTLEEYRTGPFVFYGDPREIKRIAQHFGDR